MNIAILLSGGTGERLGGDIPKQYLKAGNFMVITYALKPLLSSDLIDAVVIVADEKWREQIRKESAWLKARLQGGTAHTQSCGALRPDEKEILFADPGANRQLSILSGMEAARELLSQDTVLIHDAARPFLKEELIEYCYGMLLGHEGVMPVLPMKDTVYYSEDGRAVSRLLERDRVFAGQAPELFMFQPYYEATKSLLPDAILQVKGSTEVAIRSGMDIVMIPGDEENFKITTMPDYQRFCRLCEENGGLEGIFSSDTNGSAG